MDEINKTEKPKFWKRKIGILGKQIPVIAVLLVLVGGLGGAALLEYFGQIKTTANVQQAVTLLGNPEHTIPEDAPGGERFCYLHKLDNKASVDIKVGFETECYRDNQWENEGHTCGGVTTTTYNISETRTLELCKKDPTTWQCVTTTEDGIYDSATDTCLPPDQGIAGVGFYQCCLNQDHIQVSCKTSQPTATLTFDPVSPTFDYELVAMNLAGNTEYKLIYYQDSGATTETGKPWNMNNAVLIGTGTSYENGSLVMSDNKELGINLPKSTDYNAVPDIEDSYCDGENGYDYYDHCSGAKIWLITGEISNSNWNPTAWLFEKDLIVYSDCGLDPEDFVVDMEKTEVLETLTTKSRDKTPMLVCYDFASNIAEGTYVVTTNIVP